MGGHLYSDLRMQSYVITQFNMQVEPARDLVADQGSLSLGFDVRKKTGSEEELLLELTVTVNRDDEDYEAHGFRFLCTVAGFFELAALKRVHPDSWESLFVSNGLSILYGIARVHIDNISAVAPMGRFVLPCVDMPEFLRARQQAAQAEAAE